MNQVERRGKSGYEDLLQELENFERELMPENRAMAMELMVLEAKFRERFQHMESRIWNQYSAIFADPLNVEDSSTTLDEFKMMIPVDFPLTASVGEFIRVEKRKRVKEAIKAAAILAVITAAGVFGLASVVQLALNYIV